MNTICRTCISSLQAVNDFYLLAVASQNKILKVLEDETETECVESDVVEQEVTIEFMDIDDDAEVKIDRGSESDESQASSHLSLQASTPSPPEILSCEFCQKIYKREIHLQRHINKHHKNESSGEVQMTFLCNLCGKKFTKQEQFNKHTEEITCVSNEAPACRFCKETFSEIPQLRNHLAKNHPKGREHFCPICFKSFPTVSNRNSHLQSHNADNTVTCSICKQGFKSVLYLRKHQKAIHTKVEKVCPICDRKFDTTQQKFDYHLKTHESVKKYKCDFEGCDKSFMQHHHLENHKTTHTGIRKFLCFKCGKDFRQDCNLKAHLRTHENDVDRSFECLHPNCGKTFKSNSSYRCHKKTHEKESHCQCPECGKKFTTRSSLRTHFQTHFRDPDCRPFKCNHPGCDKTFMQERSIKYHQSTAHGIGEPIARKESQSIFYCDFCKKTFKLQSLLKRHLLVHVDGEKAMRKHKCDKCEASFKRPEHLRLHINSVHLKYKPYKCDYEDCEKSFAQIGDRNVHRKIHRDEKPHICMMCRKAFRLVKGLRAHEKTHNKMKIMQEGVIEKYEIQVHENIQLGDGIGLIEFEQDGRHFEAGQSTSTQVVFLLTSTPL